MKLLQLLEEHEVPHEGSSHRHGREGWVQVDCPFCGTGSRKFHLGINLAGLYTNCWKCGPHHLYHVLKELLNISPREIFQLVNQVKPDYEIEQRELQKKTLVIPNGVDGLQDSHIKYLRKRGFDPDELVRFWNIGGIGVAGKYQWRIFIPIYFQGNFVSWTTRSISDTATRRYMSAGANQERMNHKELLYGEDYARHTVIVCEGPTDVWRIGPGAVATCGTSFSMAQVKRITKYPRRVICFDNEPAAQARAEDLMNTIFVYDGESYNVRLDAKDAASASQEEIDKLRERFL